MSGLEVAGLALAILPIFMSAVQSYNDCSSPFIRYKKFATIAQDYYKGIEVQKIIFRNECRYLLEKFIDHNEASKMLDLPTTDAWENKQLDEQLVQQLGESLEACVTVVESIDRRIREINEDRQRFITIVEREKRGTAKSLRDKLQKLRLSFSKSLMDENVAVLRSFNDDLKTLVSQTHRCLSPTRYSTPNPFRNEILKIQNIRKASSLVHEVLRKACAEHTYHLAYFRINVEHVTLDKESSQRFKFDMAFTHSKDPIWFLLESIINDQGSCSGNQSAIVEEISPHLPPQITSPCFEINARTGVRSNFCDHLWHEFRSPDIGTCVVLENTVDRKHIVYPSDFTLSPKIRKSCSLEKLVTSSNIQGFTKGLSVYERINLAKTLATAALQYYDTPWWEKSLRSKDILFFGIKDDTEAQKNLDFSTPYINVMIERGFGNTSIESEPLVARNPFLFSLSIMLLEIAHQTSLGNLRIPQDAEKDSRHCEFFTARRLAKQKQPDLGVKYQKIVERLVECDFGHGDDLNDPKLQAAYYENVICPLDDLEKKLRELLLD